MVGEHAHEVKAQQRAVGDAVEIDVSIAQRAADVVHVRGVLQAVVGGDIDSRCGQPGAAVTRHLGQQRRILLVRRHEEFVLARLHLGADEIGIRVEGAPLVEEDDVPPVTQRAVQQQVGEDVDGGAAGSALGHEERVVRRRDARGRQHDHGQANRIHRGRVGHVQPPLGDDHVAAAQVVAAPRSQVGDRGTVGLLKEWWRLGADRGSKQQQQRQRHEQSHPAVREGGAHGRGHRVRPRPGRVTERRRYQDGAARLQHRARGPQSRGRHGRSPRWRRR